jgi:5-methylcytosine-specific restriction endonuclease McrA
MSKILGDLTYEQYINHWIWKDKVQFMLANQRLVYGSNFCENCGESTGFLQVHHRHYKTLGNEGYQDLIICCKPCHKELDEKRKKGDEWNGD